MSILLSKRIQVGNDVEITMHAHTEGNKKVGVGFHTYGLKGAYLGFNALLTPETARELAASLIAGADAIAPVAVLEDAA